MTEAGMVGALEERMNRLADHVMGTLMRGEYEVTLRSFAPGATWSENGAATLVVDRVSKLAVTHRRLGPRHHKGVRRLITPDRFAEQHSTVWIGPDGRRRSVAVIAIVRANAGYSAPTPKPSTPGAAAPQACRPYGASFGSGQHMCIGLSIVVGQEGEGGSHVDVIKRLIEAGSNLIPGGRPRRSPHFSRSTQASPSASLRRLSDRQRVGGRPDAADQVQRLRDEHELVVAVFGAARG
jgi:hypothetical protein